ncbi:MAG: hypothetical protein GY817_05085 [bacterium]|nr:hypothetical protein [bacterium]
MISKLELLVKLQAIDLKILQLTKEKKESAGLIEEAKKVFSEEKIIMSTIKKLVIKKQLEKKQLELELAETESNIDKHNTELNTVKSNQLYHTILEIIKNEKQKQSDLEDKILQEFDDIDHIQAEVDSETEKLKTKEQEYHTKKMDIETRYQEIEHELLSLSNERENQVTNIDPSVLKVYDKIHTHKKGLTLAKINTEFSSCTGCNMHIPPQKISEVSLATTPIFCENCNRILYIEEKAE